MFIICMKYFIYTSFALNILAGLWVTLGIIQWISELNKKD